MAKTYNTISTVNTGDVYTATAHNAIATNVNNYRVPPMCEVYRTSNLTSYTPNTAITWQAERYDTDGMWTSGSSITIGTDGIYAVVFNVGINCTATLSVIAANVYKGAQLAAVSYAPAVAGNESFTSTTGTMQLVAGDTISAACAFSGGSAYIVTGSAAAYAREQSRLSVTWLGQAS